MNNIKRPVIILLAALLLFGTACAPALVAVNIPNLDDVTEALGYSLVLTYMPEGFEFKQYEVFNFGAEAIQPGGRVVMPLGEHFANLVYERYENYVYNYITIQYPQSFPPSVSNDFLLENLGIEWQRPDDAVSEVKVNGKTAYLVKGSWSAESLQYLSKPDPEFLATYTPVWDYDMPLSLFFDFELSQDETVGVMMRAMLYPTEWITPNEMVRSAESLQRVD
jgi:hypothetical protein